MTLTDAELCERLRRTLDTVAHCDLEAEPLPGPRRRGRPLLVAAAMACLVGLGVTAAALRPAGTKVTVADAPAGTRRVEDYGPSQGEADLLFRGEQRLLADCMQKAGQPYQAVEPPSRRPLDEHWSWLGRTDPELAAAHGYAVLGADDPIEPNGPGSTVRTQPERDAWSQAFYGSPWASTGPTPAVPIVDPRTAAEVGG